VKSAAVCASGLRTGARAEGAAGASLGLRAYLIPMSSNRARIWNIAFQFVAGGGRVDIIVSPKAVAALRISTQHVFEMTNCHANEHVARLWLLGAGMQGRV